ncbi:MAG: hypothetical protein IJM21_12595 [Clostridia bacterium]|nr:hypothetical protein [Clostridia bacterium]
MDYGFSILMLIFAGAILLYAAVLALTKDYKMLPYRARNSVKPKDPKRYAFQLSKAIALTAAAPALCGLIAFWHPVPAVIVLIAGLVVCLWLATKIMKNVH